jgi:serine/threonine protein kinase
MLVGIPPYYNDDIKVLYKNIEKGKLKIPKYLSKEARNLLTKLLHKDPKKRPVFGELKGDPFFKYVNWNDLFMKRLSPPTVL